MASRPPVRRQPLHGTFSRCKWYSPVCSMEAQLKPKRLKKQVAWSSVGWR